MTEDENKKLPLVLVLIAVAIIVIATASYFITRDESPKLDPEDTGETIEDVADTDMPLPKTVIGRSVEDRVIESYSFGTGTTTLLFVGGIHGGYEWNSSLLAYQFINELDNERITVPDNLTIKIIPVLNPDGLYKAIEKEGEFTEQDVISKDPTISAAGRFNANSVDLNRNFDCKWKPTSTWKGQIVDAGSEAFSEPEALALKNLVEKDKPVAVIFWHSQAGAVYASECEEGVLPETLTLMNTYAKAAEYRAVESFDAYPISGDAEGWLASLGIPAITVELTTRDEMEWFKNQKGFEAVLELYQTTE